MRKLKIFYFFLKLGKSSFEPVRHFVGKHDDDDDKPWRLYVKKYTEGICEFDRTRNDCAECVNVSYWESLGKYGKSRVIRLITNAKKRVYLASSWPTNVI